MSVAVIHQYEKNNDAAAAAFDNVHAETKQLQKMSLSDPQEQKKEKEIVGSGPNQLRTHSPGAYSCVDNDRSANMSVAVIHQYEKNNAVAADLHDVHAETNHLRKMSLSDCQQQNTKDVDGEDGSNQFQTHSPGASSCVDDVFGRIISTEEAKESMKREREWMALNTCTRCGFFDHSCLCKVRAQRRGRPNVPYEFKKIPAKKEEIYDKNALPPWLSKRRQKVLDEKKGHEFSLLVIYPEK